MYTYITHNMNKWMTVKVQFSVSSYQYWMSKTYAETNGEGLNELGEGLIYIGEGLTEIR